ncbi:MAG TPA: hypothetical protein VIM01_05480 [Dermatophilaceae bacterium]|jgi:hypothetical protein
MSDHTVAPIEHRSRPLVRWIVLAVMALLMVLIVGNVVQSRAEASRVVPQSAAMEKALGVRFSRVAVVADGGLITVSYVVLDPEKASRFQLDGAHPPVLHSESRGLSTNRVSLMKQGHTLRAGQTYYLVYQNTRGALRPDERVSIDAGALHLRHVPVL